MSPKFLSLDDILFIHSEEINTAGGEPNIRDPEGIKACIESPKTTFDGDYLLDLYGVAVAYVSCFVFRHPFIDGNKRTALASCLTFLYLNGFEVNEEHDEELADLVVDLVTKKIDTDFLSDFLRTRSSPIS